MNTITFTCETITPMFLSGADGSTPELRPPSIKGALRFWWRAMNGHLDLKTLKEHESLIFGGTDGESGGRSSFGIKSITPLKLLPNQINKYSPVPHWEGKQGRKPFFNDAIKERVIIEVELILFKESKIDNYIFNENTLENLFIAFSLLGALGKRSRRGFGSFKITHIDRNKKGKQNFEFDYSLESIKEVLNKVISSNFDIKGTDLNCIKKPNHNSAYPFIKKIKIGNVVHPNLLIKIGNETSSLKSSNNKWDYNNAMGHTEKRFASPIFVSAIEKGQQIMPIITTLNTALEGGRSLSIASSTIQANFQKAIL